MPWNLAVFGPVIAEKEIPLVFWMHNRTLGKHWIERWAGRTRPNLVICNSYFTSQSLPSLFARHIPPHEVIFYPVASSINGVDRMNDKLTIRKEVATSPTAVVIIQVSRMEPFKGHLLHIDALARLRSVPDWVCWMVGGAQRACETNYLTQLQAKAATAGIDHRIRFLGERRDVQRLLSAADIFCQPNLSGEAFGIVFVEALYNRLPVVSTAIGGALEIIDESCGRLVCQRAEALAEALSRLILDASLRTELGAEGPKRANALCSPACSLARLADSLKRCEGTGRYR
jgi:glycosyltransferase involved in cell wall biosynthesis